MKMTKRLLSVLLASTFLLSLNVFAEPKVQEEATSGISQEQPEFVPEEEPGGELGPEDLKDEETEVPENDEERLKDSDDLESRYPAEKEELAADSALEENYEQKEIEDELNEEIEPEVSAEALYNQDIINRYGNPLDNQSMVDIVNNNYSFLPAQSENSTDAIADNLEEENYIKNNDEMLFSDEMLGELAASSSAVASVDEDSIYKVDPVASPMYFNNGNDDSVSLQTGDLMYTKSLFSFPGRNGLDLDVSIRYNSSDAVATIDEYELGKNLDKMNYRQFAAGWIFNFSNLNIANEEHGNGYRKKFSLSLANGSSYELSGTHILNYQLEDMVLTEDAVNNQYVLTYSNGREERFDKEYGNIVSIKDVFGNTIHFEYGNIEYHSGSFFNYLFKVNYYSRTLRALKKITDSTGREINVEYGHKSSFSGKRIDSITFQYEGNVLSKLNLDTKETSKGKVYTLTSVEDASNFVTSYEYNENQTYTQISNEIGDKSIVHSGAYILLTKVNYPTGGYSNYEYTTARRIYQPAGIYRQNWYLMYKLSKKTDSSGHSISYQYENDYSGYPYGYIVDSTTSKPINVDMQYHTIVKYPNYETVYTFDRNHNMIKEQTYDKNEKLVSYAGSGGDTKWNVSVNNELYRIVAPSVLDGDEFRTLVYKTDLDGNTHFLSSIDERMFLKAVKTAGNAIYLFGSNTNLSGGTISVYKYDIASDLWEKYADTHAADTIDFARFYYSGNVFSFDQIGSNGLQSIIFNPNPVSGQSCWSDITVSSVWTNKSTFYLYSLEGSHYFRTGSSIIKYTPLGGTAVSKTFASLPEVTKGVGINEQGFVYTDTQLYMVNYEQGTIQSLCTLSGLPSGGRIYPDMYSHLYYLVKDNNIYTKINKVSMSSPNTAIQYAERLFPTKTANVIMGLDTMYIALCANDSSIGTALDFAGGFEKVTLTDSTKVTYNRKTDYTYNDYNQQTGMAYSIAKGSTVSQMYTEGRTYVEKHDVPLSTTDRLGNRTTYEYTNSTYYIPTKVTQFAGTANALITNNTLSSDKKKIISTSTLYDDRTLTTEYTYDTTYPGNIVGEILKEVRPAQTEKELQNISYEYNSYNAEGRNAYITRKSINNVVSHNSDFEKTSRSSNVHEYYYDKHGRLLKDHQLWDRWYEYTYLANGWIASEQTPDFIVKEYTYTLGQDGVNKRETEYKCRKITGHSDPIFPLNYSFIEYYDDLGRVTKRSEEYTGSGGEKTLARFVYDGHNVSEVYDAENNKTVYAYDSFDRPAYTAIMGEDDTEINEQSISYDDFSLTTSQYYGSNNSKSLYQSVTTDVAGRVVSEKNYIISKLYRETLTSYDYMGNVSTVTDPKGNVTRYTYNDLGQMTKVTDALLQNTLYEYDSLGNTTKMTTPGGSVTQYEYDTLSRLIKETDALGNSDYYSYYDVDERLGKTKDKNNVITTYEYDYVEDNYAYQSGWLSSKIIGDKTINYTYDDWANYAQINDGGSVTSYTYTGNNLLKTKTTPDNKTITYEYDARRNISKVTDYSGTETTYTYDAANRMISAASNGLTTQYEYENEQGLLSKVSYGSSGKYQTFEYNLQGEPTFTQKDSLPYRYDYDDNGNLLKESLGVTRINEYTYDELNRLNTTLDEFSATTQYGYDANNNIVSKEISHYRGATVNLSNAGTTVPFTNVTHHTEEMTYNAANQLTRREETVTGTNNGTTITQTSTDTYTYTANGSMSTKQETLGSSALSKTYSYNDRNQLIQYKEGSTVKGTYTYDPEGFRSSKTAGGKTTCFYWDRGYTINESDGTNFTARNTIGIGGIIARKTSAATTYLAKDIHGDTAYTLNTNGTKDAGYRYFAFGEQWSHSGSQDNPYRYCGEYIDNETGFIYLRNRYYDPKLGRFISEDPAKSGSNWYVYCENNPLKFVDPWGLVAGEKFRTLQELSNDWGWNYFPTSEYIMMEQASAIYKGYDEKGVYYSYTEAIVGGPHKTDLDAAEAMIPYGDGVTYVGAIHSHPQGGDISDNDKSYANNNDKLIIAVYFQPDNKGWGNVIARTYSAGGAPGPLSNNVPMPNPWLSEERKAYLRSLTQYANKWYNHETPDCRKETSTCDPDAIWKPDR